MTSLEEQMEEILDDDTDESRSVNEMQGSDYEDSSSDGSTRIRRRYDRGFGRGWRRQTDGTRALEPLVVGDTVEAHGVTWERIDGLTVDRRKEEEQQTTFAHFRFDESTKEVDMFLQLMPLQLLQIVRDGVAASADK
jgi:hypothetical protein